MNISKWFNKKYFFSAFSIIGLGIVFYYTWDYFSFCDEFENLYDTYLLANGLLPHKDYWRTKLPGLHLLFSPLFMLLDPRLSKHQLHFVLRAIVLLLQCFSQIYFLRQILAFTDTGIKDRDESKNNVLFYIMIALTSYVISTLLRTNLFWNESFQYCYLLVSSAFFLKLNSHKIRYRDYILFGLASSVSVLISLIAIPIVICNIVFVAISLFMLPLELRRKQIRRSFHALGTLCLILISFIWFIVDKVGWTEFYYQVWVINQKYNAIMSFGYTGVIGVVLKPLDFVLECLRTSTLRPELTPDREYPITSFFLILSCFTIINYLFLNIKTKYRWLLLAFFSGLIYSSFVRGIAFHVGFAFHFAFTLSIVWLILLYKKRVIDDLPLLSRVFLFVPVAICIYLCFYACIELNIYIDKCKTEQGLIPTESSYWISEKEKLFSLVGDRQAQEHRCWVPFFEPKALYYANLLPANKVYMFLSAFVDEPSLISSYEAILANENILIYPGDSKGFSDKLRRMMVEKLRRQSRYIPTSICNFNTLIHQKNKNLQPYYQYIKIQRLSEPMGGGIKLVGVANRGYKYSFFFEHNNELPTNTKFLIRLDNKDGILCYGEVLYVKQHQLHDEGNGIYYQRDTVSIKAYCEDNKLRIDWEIPYIADEIRRNECSLRIGFFWDGKGTYCWHAPFVL